MYPCSKCGIINPLSTRFCRNCGERIELTRMMINKSVTTTTVGKYDAMIAGWGRSTLTLGVFALVCALVFRYVAVPTMPTADLPQANPGEPLAELGANAGLAGTPEASERLRWRRLNASRMMGDLGLDMAALRIPLDAALKNQSANGIVSGSTDSISATALAALAWQGLPDDRLLDAARRARGFLLGKLGDMPGMDPTPRALLLTALIDAEALNDNQLLAYRHWLRDPKQAAIQALAVACLKPSQRMKPDDMRLLANAMKDERWSMLIEIFQGRQPLNVLPAQFDLKAAAALDSGEDRIWWSLLAWQVAVAPVNLTDTLKAWTTSPANISPELSARGGKDAAALINVIAITTPLRLTPLWLQPRTP